MRPILAGLLCLILSGCATVDLGLDDSDSNADAAGSRGVTTLAAPTRPSSNAVLAIPVAVLGKPDSVLPVLVDGNAVTSSLSEDALKAGFDSADSAEMQGAPSRIIIDTTGVIRTTGLVDPKLMPERRKTGEKTTANPNYARAQEAVRSAEENLRQAEEANGSVQQSSKEMAATKGVGAWGAVLGSLTAVMGTSSLETAKQQLKDARSEAAAVKQTTSEPVYEQVEVAAVTERTVLAGEARVYQVDKRTHLAKVVAIPVNQITDRPKKLSGTALVDTGTASATATPAAVDLKMADIMHRLDAVPAMDAQALAQEIDSAHARAKEQGSVFEDRTMAETAASRDKLAQLAALTSPSKPPGDSANGSDVGASAVGTSGAAGTSASGDGEACHTTAAFLSDSIPPFTQPMLEEIRTKMLAADLRDEMSKAKARGETPQQMVENLFQQGRAYDKSAAEAASTAAAVDAMGTTDQEFMAKLKNHSLELGDCGAIRSSSLCSAALFKMSAVFYRAMGAEIDCHVRHGTWGK